MTTATPMRRVPPQLIPIEVSRPLIIGTNSKRTRDNEAFLKSEHTRIRRQTPATDPEVIISRNGRRAQLIRWVTPAEIKKDRYGVSLYGFKHPDAARLIARRAAMENTI